MTDIEKTLIKSNVQAQITGQYIAPIELVGPPGTFKSQGTAAIAKELNMELLSVSGCTVQLEEWSGLPNEATDTAINSYASVNSDAHKYTQWSVPELIYQANKLAATNSNGCIILIDDVHAMQKTTQDALYELLLERKLKQYKLLPNVAIVLTRNNSIEAGNDGTSSAIVNRKQSLFMQFNPSQWYDKVGITLNTYVSSFLKLNLNFLQEQESTEDPYGTPRSWDFLSTCIDNLPNEFVVENAYKIAKQYISNEAATEFARHVQYIEKINFRKVLDSDDVPNLSKLDATDQLIYPFIIDWAETYKDTVFIINTINTNSTNQSFIGFSAGKLYSLYSKRENNQPITDGQSILLDKVLNSFNVSNYKIPKKDQKLVTSTVIEDRQTVISTMSDYISG